MWKHLKTKIISTQCFSMLYGIIIIIESYFYDKMMENRNKFTFYVIVVKIMVTNVIFALTLPLYVGLYLQKFPQYGIIVSETYIYGEDK